MNKIEKLSEMDVLGAFIFGFSMLFGLLFAGLEQSVFFIIAGLVATPLLGIAGYRAFRPKLNTYIKP